MADSPLKLYLRDIVVNNGPFDPVVDTIVVVKDGREYRVPFWLFDDGRSKALTPTITANTVTIEYSRSDYFIIDITDEINVWAFDAMPPNQTSATLAIMLRQGAVPKNVNFPTTFLWSGTPPVVSLEPNAIDLLIITTFDRGVTWLADLARNYKAAPSGS